MHDAPHDQTRLENVPPTLEALHLLVALELLGGGWALVQQGVQGHEHDVLLVGRRLGLVHCGFLVHLLNLIGVCVPNRRDDAEASDVEVAEESDTFLGMGCVPWENNKLPELDLSFINRLLLMWQGHQACELREVIGEVEVCHLTKAAVALQQPHERERLVAWIQE